MAASMSLSPPAGTIRRSARRSVTRWLRLRCRSERNGRLFYFLFVLVGVADLRDEEIDVVLEALRDGCCMGARRAAAEAAAMKQRDLREDRLVPVGQSGGAKRVERRVVA